MVEAVHENGRGHADVDQRFVDARLVRVRVTVRVRIGVMARVRVRP